jgi:hypothetical protein
MNRKILYLPSEDPVILDRFAEITFSDNLVSPGDTRKNFQFYVYLEKYLLVIKDGVELYSILFKGLTHGQHVVFEVFSIMKGKYCEFVEHIIWCYSKVVPDNSKKGKNKNYYEDSDYLVLYMKSGKIFTRKILSFIPNMNNLIYGRAFYMSKYEDKVFYTFTSRSSIFYAVKSGPKGYLDKINLPFIKENMYPDLHFREITYDTFYIMYDNWENRDIQIWVYTSQSILYYPAFEYMTDYYEMIKTNVDVYSGTFYVMYTTKNQSVRCILFNFNKNPMKRVLRDFEVFRTGCPSSEINHDMSFIDNYLYLTFLCRVSNEYKIFVSFIYYGISLKIEHKKDYYDFTMGRISREFQYQLTDYYDNINVEVLPVVYKNSLLTKETINLENNGYLRLQGDVVKILMTSDNPFVKFYERVTQVETQVFVHKEPLLDDGKFSVNNTLGGHIRVVTDEYIITDYDRQFNNYYSNCDQVNFQSYEFFHPNIDTLFFCDSLKSSEFIITDFKDVKIIIKEGMGSLSPNLPKLIFIKNSLFICHQTVGSVKVTVSKYLFDKNDLYHIKHVSTVFIDSDVTATTFEELSTVIPMYYPEHDTIYFLFDLMHSKNFVVQGYRVEQNFVTMEDNYKIISDDDNVPIYYLK